MPYKAGMALVGQSGWHKPDRRVYFVVDSPGCALGIWQFSHSSPNAPLQLEEDYTVEGTVHDHLGKPVEGAELFIGKFGISTYTNVRLDLPGAILPFFTTKTDHEGRYRFRGAILQHFAWDAGVNLFARKKSADALVLGSRAISFIGPQAFF